MTDKIVEAMARAISDYADGETMSDERWDEAQQQSDFKHVLAISKAALAAARPLIEAEVREECAKIAERTVRYLEVSDDGLSVNIPSNESCNRDR